MWLLSQTDSLSSCMYIHLWLYFGMQVLTKWMVVIWFYQYVAWLHVHVCFPNLVFSFCLNQYTCINMWCLLDTVEILMQTIQQECKEFLRVMLLIARELWSNCIHNCLQVGRKEVGEELWSVMWAWGSEYICVNLMVKKCQKWVLCYRKLLRGVGAVLSTPQVLQ